MPMNEFPNVWPSGVDEVPNDQYFQAFQDLINRTANLNARALAPAQIAFLAGLLSNPPTLGPLSVQPRFAAALDLDTVDGLPGELARPIDFKGIVQLTGTPGDNRVYLPAFYGDSLEITDLDDSGVNGSGAPFDQPFYRQVYITGIAGTASLDLASINGIVDSTVTINNLTSTPVDVTNNDARTTTVPPNTCAVYAYVYQPGLSVSVPVLVARSALGDSSPLAAISALRTYVTQPRNLLGAASDINTFTGLPAKYIVKSLKAFSATGTPAAATVGLYTAASGGGTAIVAPATFTSLTSAEKFSEFTIADPTTYKTASSLYLRKTVGQSITVTFALTIEDLTGRRNMTIEALFGTGMVLRGLSVAENFQIISTPIYNPVGGSTTPQTVDDVTLNRTTGASTTVSAQISIDKLDTEFSITNMSPGVATLSGNILSPVGVGGTATVHVSRWPCGTRRADIAVNDGQPLSYNTLTGYVAGSYAKHLYDSIAAMVAGKTAGDDTMRQYNGASYNAASPAGVRNPLMFASALDLSGVSFTTTHDGNAKTWYNPAALLRDSANSGRFVASSTHVPVTQDDTVVFCRADGSFQIVTCLDSVPLGDDFHLSYLSAPVTGCNAMRILPDDWITYLPVAQLDDGCLPALFKGAKLPSGVSGSGDRVRITFAKFFGANTISTYGSSTDEQGGPGKSFPPVLSAFDSWRLPILGGDSGGVLFLPTNGQPVYLGQQWHYGDSSSVLAHVAAAESWMSTKLGASVTLSRADLTMFNTY